MEEKKKVVHLRPVSSYKKEIIKKNLQSLQSNPKKLAQDLYYQHTENSGISPLLREKRKPVHLRLGRRVPILGTNTSALLPKRKFIRNNVQQGRITRVKNMNIAQARLNNIRQNHQEIIAHSSTYGLEQPKRIRLRRNLPQFIVQVKNNTHENGHPSRFKLKLNPLYQSEIKLIQDSGGREIILGVPFIRPAVTNITINERFSFL